MSPTPYGDLDEYSFYEGPFPFEKRADKEVGSLTVFAGVRAARRASIAILHSGACVAHQQEPFALWAKCEHLRAGNVLLIMPSDIAALRRRTLIAALRKLGRPTSP